MSGTVDVVALPDEPGLAEALAYGDSYLAFRQRFDRIPGVQAAVLAEGDIRLSSAHGLADVATETPLTDKHLFRVASQSKTVTATLIFQLVEDGVLRLDDTAGQLVPELTASPVADRSIRELLSHSAGLFRDGADGDFWQLSRPFPARAELMESLHDQRAAVLPANERFKYSNMGYGLLGLIIEAASGSSYQDLVDRRIAGPLGLVDFGPELNPDRAAELASGYSSLAHSEHRSLIQHVDTGSLGAATGFCSTATDLVRYFAAHRLGDTSLLTDSSKRRMQQSQWQVGSGADRRYGLGLALTRIGKRELIGHGGGYPGHCTCTVVDPQTGLVVSVLTNAIDGPAQSLTHALVKLIDLAGATARPEQPSIDPARFTGRYASLWGVVDIASLGGRLFRIHPAQADPTDGVAELRIVDQDTLQVAGGDGYGSFGEQLTFTFGPDGAVAGVRGESRVSLVPWEKFTVPAVVQAPFRS
jgi:CubicO group peptidase (beta-lactamase class C family)